MLPKPGDIFLPVKLGRHQNVFSQQGPELSKCWAAKIWDHIWWDPRDREFSFLWGNSKWECQVRPSQRLVWCYSPYHLVPVFQYLYSRSTPEEQGGVNLNSVYVCFDILGLEPECHAKLSYFIYNQKALRRHMLLPQGRLQCAGQISHENWGMSVQTLALNQRWHFILGASPPTCKFFNEGFSWYSLALYEACTYSTGKA